MWKRRKRCSDKTTGQELARAMVPWHNAVFAADASVRVAECGAKGLGLVARRDLDNADVPRVNAAVPSVQRDGLCASSEPIPAGERRAWAFCTAWPTVVVISVLVRVSASFFTES